MMKMIDAKNDIINNTFQAAFQIENIYWQGSLGSKMLELNFSPGASIAKHIIYLKNGLQFNKSKSLS